MRATAHLPNIDIEIVHRRAPDGDAEQIFINMQATPSFETFGRVLEAANPFAFWAQASRLVWLSSMDAAKLRLPSASARRCRPDAVPATIASPDVRAG